MVGWQPQDDVCDLVASGEPLALFTVLLGSAPVGGEILR